MTPEDEDDEPFEDKMRHLVSQWREQQAEGARLDAQIEKNFELSAMARKALTDVAEIVMGQSPPCATVFPSGTTPLLNGPTEFGPSHPTATQFTTDGRRFAKPKDILFCVRARQLAA